MRETPKYPLYVLCFEAHQENGQHEPVILGIYEHERKARDTARLSEVKELARKLGPERGGFLTIRMVASDKLPRVRGVPMTTREVREDQRVTESLGIKSRFDAIRVSEAMLIVESINP